ncbi:hypothetical protein ON010_g8499 [Phytophthora cinnamomi]|nr:hypothetical protein ON010_g8499 [Phytophthora cinnamomi]
MTPRWYCILVHERDRTVVRRGNSEASGSSESANCDAFPESCRPSLEDMLDSAPPGELIPSMRRAGQPELAPGPKPANQKKRRVKMRAPAHSGQTPALPTSHDASAQSIWEGIAERQLEERLSVEKAQRELSAACAGTVKLVRDLTKQLKSCAKDMRLSALMRQKPAQLWDFRSADAAGPTRAGIKNVPQDATALSCSSRDATTHYRSRPRPGNRCGHGQRCRVVTLRLTDSETIVWAKYVEPVDFNGVTYPGMYCRKTGWIKLQRAAGQDTPSTVAEMYSEMTPVFKDGVENQNWQIRALVDSMARAHKITNSIYCEMIRDLLLEEDWKATFGSGNHLTIRWQFRAKTSQRTNTILIIIGAKRLGIEESGVATGRRETRVASIDTCTSTGTPDGPKTSTDPRPRTRWLGRP